MLLAVSHDDELLFWIQQHDIDISNNHINNNHPHGLLFGGPRYNPRNDWNTFPWTLMKEFISIPSRNPIMFDARHFVNIMGDLFVQCICCAYTLEFASSWPNKYNWMYCMSASQQSMQPPEPMVMLIFVRLPNFFDMDIPTWIIYNLPTIIFTFLSGRYLYLRGSCADMVKMQAKLVPSQRSLGKALPSTSGSIRGAKLWQRLRWRGWDILPTFQPPFGDDLQLVYHVHHVNRS